MKNHVAVGTYQKTGTVWMANTFSSLADRVSVRYKNISRYRPELKVNRVKSRHLGIVFDNHTALPEEFGQLEVRGFRMIRDPRDMLISATKYHQRTDNRFANRPRVEFGGKSLKEALLDLDTFEEKMLFEIEHYAYKNLRPMTEFPDWDNFVTVRYEDLVQDRSLSQASRLLAWLGFHDDEVLVGLNCLWRNSLFGELDPGSTGHISDGSTEQYKRVFSEEVHDAFLERFRDDLEVLGYLDGTPGWSNQGLEGVQVSESVLSCLEAYADDSNEAMRASARMAMELAPDRPGGYMEMGFLEQRAGNESAARRWFEMGKAVATRSAPG